METRDRWHMNRPTSDLQNKEGRANWRFATFNAHVNSFDLAIMITHLQPGPECSTSVIECIYCLYSRTIVGIEIYYIAKMFIPRQTTQSATTASECIFEMSKKIYLARESRSRLVI